MKIDRILLTTDFSPCARQAYGPARDLARKLNAHLDLVHCLTFPEEYVPAGLARKSGAPAFLWEIQRKRLEEEAGHPLFEELRPTPHCLENYGAEETPPPSSPPAGHRAGPTSSSWPLTAGRDSSASSSGAWRRR